LGELTETDLENIDTAARLTRFAHPADAIRLVAEVRRLREEGIRVALERYRLQSLVNELTGRQSKAALEVADRVMERVFGHRWNEDEGQVCLWVQIKDAIEDSMSSEERRGP
jgi:uncharacterized protein (DUF2252 family)